MKHVNVTPELELKKAKIMEEFNQGNGPEPGPKQSYEDELVEKLEENFRNNMDRQENLDAGEESKIASDDELVEWVIDALKTVYDPEIPVNIYDLGLVYRVEIKDSFVEIDMTLTAPGCPVAETFPGMVERSVELVPGINKAVVEIVWDPPWSPDLISEAARLELGLI